jgi:hypothetical protein
MRWAAFCAVHGIVSVHAVVELRNDARDLHHLTGHYPCFHCSPRISQARSPQSKASVEAT